MSSPDKPLPDAQESERALVSSLILAPELAPKACELIGHGDFVSKRWGAAFGAVERIVERGDVVDVALISGELKAVDAGLTEDLDTKAHGANLETYVAQIKEASRKRRLALGLHKFEEQLYDSAVNASDALSNYLELARHRAHRGRQQFPNPRYRHACRTGAARLDRRGPCA